MKNCLFVMLVTCSIFISRSYSQTTRNEQLESIKTLGTLTPLASLIPLLPFLMKQVGDLHQEIYYNLVQGVKLFSLGADNRKLKYELTSHWAKQSWVELLTQPHPTSQSKHPKELIECRESIAWFV